MANGRLYDAATMHETGNHPAERQPFFFERERQSDGWVWQGHVDAHGHGQCRH
jgi:hypothetical protein